METQIVLFIVRMIITYTAASKTLHSPVVSMVIYILHGMKKTRKPAIERGMSAPIVRCGTRESVYQHRDRTELTEWTVRLE